MIKLNRRIAALRPSATLAADQRAKEMRAAGIDVIKLSGEIDMSNVDSLRVAIEPVLEKAPERVDFIRDLVSEKLGAGTDGLFEEGQQQFMFATEVLVEESK